MRLPASSSQVRSTFGGCRRRTRRPGGKLAGPKKLARRLLIDGEPNLRSTFMAAYEHSGRDVAKISFSETSIGSDFGMVEEKLALAMPKQAETAPPPAGAGCKAAPGGSANASEPAAAAAEEAVKQVAATAAAAAEAASNVAHEQQQKDEAAKRKHEEEAADMAAVRNEIRIAMDDVLTIFDNAPRSGCPAPEQVKEASWVVFVIPVQSYVRGRPSKAMPCFQTEHVLELQWASARDMVLVGCGHDPSGVQAVMSKSKQFRSAEVLYLESFGASCSGEGEKEALRRIHVARCWPKVPVHGVSALFRAFKEGLPKYQVAAQALW